MSDSDWPPPREDDDNTLEHSKSLEWIDDSEPVIMGPYVAGGTDLPPQVDVEPPQPEPPAPSGDE